jgi:hypothetical protein
MGLLAARIIAWFVLCAGLGVLALPALVGQLARPALTPPALGSLQVATTRADSGWTHSAWEGVLSSALAQLDYRWKRAMDHGPLLSEAGQTRFGRARIRERLDLGAGAPLAEGVTWLAWNGDWASNWALPGAGPGALDLEFTRREHLGRLRLALPGALPAGLPTLPLQGLEGALRWEQRSSQGVGPRLLDVRLSAAALTLATAGARFALRDARLVVEHDPTATPWGGSLRAEAQFADSPSARLRLRATGRGPEPLSSLVAVLRDGTRARPDLIDGLADLRIRIEALELSTPRGSLRLRGSLRGVAARDLASALVLRGDLDLDPELLLGELERIARQRLAIRTPDLPERGVLGRERLDEAAAAEARRQLELITAQGLLRLEAGRYRARVSWRNGRLSLNGRRLHPERFVRE